MKAELNFNPARALTAGNQISKVNSVRESTFSIRETPNAFFKNPASMEKKIMDTYYPSSKIKDTPLTLYKYNSATKSIKKIKIVDY